MFHYKFTDKEIETILKTLVIVIDSRENKNEHIREYLNQKGIPYEICKLDHGDYGCKIVENKEIGIQRDIHLTSFVERKNGVDEITGNLQKDTRQAFINELIRAQNSRFVLIVEDIDFYKKVIRGEYRSKYNPLALLGTLNSLKAKYNFEIVPVEKKFAGNWIYHHFYYQAKHYLKTGIF